MTSKSSGGIVYRRTYGSLGDTAQIAPERCSGPPLNFTLVDLLSTSAAIIVFPLFIVIPGFLLGRLLNLFSFRRRTPLLRLLLSLPLSLALTPVILYLLGRYFSTGGVWLFYALIWTGFIALVLFGNLRRLSPNPFSGKFPLAGKFPPGVRKPLILICTVWTAVVILSLVDLQFGSKLYYSAVSYDYTIRSIAIGQLARAHWYPPANPFFFPGHPVPFRYHYFWFLLCSWVVRLAPGLIGPRHALFAGGVWIGFTLMATVALTLRFFTSEGRHLIRRRTLLAFALLSVTGFDILPTLVLAFCRIKFHFTNIFPTVDWWNLDQVTGWLDSALWVPHHLAACLCCITGFLILWTEWHSVEEINGPERVRNRDGPEPVRRIRWQAVFGAALAFASAGGLSVYVAFPFAAFLAIYTVTALIRKQYREFLMLALAAVIALALGLPFIHELIGAGSAGTVAGSRSSFIRFGIRTFQPAHLALYLLHHETPVWTTLADILLLPLNFLLELGVLFVIGFLKIRQWMSSRCPFTEADRAAVMMVSVSLFISIFLRSNTIEANDLGMRAMLIVQFFLVIWGADVLADVWEDGRSPAKITRDRGVRFAQGALAASLILGATSNLYELFILRSYTLLTEAGMDPGTNWINPGKNFAARAFSSRQLYEWLNRHIAQSAIEQHNPFDLHNPVPGLYADRQMGMLDTSAPAAFGGDIREGASMARSLRTLFLPGFPSADVDGICGRYKIDYLIVRSGDPVWDDPNSWVWKRNPTYSNPLARAFACGFPNQSPAPPLASLPRTGRGP